MTDPSAPAAIELLALRDPAALDLARLASLAARIEPELVRSLRLALVPRATAGTEAEVWFSEAIHARGARAASFAPEVSRWLRDQLALVDRTQLARALAIVRRVHRAAPPLLRLEERLIAWSILRRTARIDAALASIVAAMIDEPARAEDLAAWAQRALPRLPIAARDAESYWSLVFAANQLLPSTSFEPPAHPSAVTAPVPALFASATDAFVAIERRGDTVRLRRVDAPGPDTIVAPAIRPLVVVVTSSGLPPQARIADRDWSDDVAVAGPIVRFRVADGREHVATTVAAAAPIDETATRDAIVAFFNRLIELADLLPEPYAAAQVQQVQQHPIDEPLIEPASPPRTVLFLALDAPPPTSDLSADELTRLRTIAEDPDLDARPVMPIAQGTLPDSFWMLLSTTRAGVEALRTAYRHRRLEQLDGANVFWLAERTPLPDLDDPNRGRFGGVPDSEHLSVRARVEQIARHEYRIEVRVRADGSPGQRAQGIEILDGSGQPHRTRAGQPVTFTTWRACTIGVLRGEHAVELDLRNAQDAPDGFVDPPHALSAIPLEPGTRWRYRRSIGVTSISHGDQSETSMEIIDAHVVDRARPIVVALMRGHYRERSAGPWLLVRRGSMYFDLPGDAERLDRVRRGEERMEDALTYEQLAFRFPITTGAPIVPARPTTRSHWICDKAEIRDEGSGTYDFVTRGGNAAFTVETGVGVKRYAVNHGDDTSDHLELIELIRSTR